FERFMGTGVARLRVMWNTIVEVARIVGDVYNPVIKQAADFTQGVADALRRMTPEQQRAIAEFGALATAVLGGIAAVLLAIKTITTFATGLVLLTRAVVFFLSPWTLLTMAVIAAAIAIASKWDEIIAKIENTDLGQAAKRTWEDFVRVWQSDELTLPEKVLESVKITVKTVLGLTESIGDWFVNSSIDLVRDVAVELGVDWDNSKLGKLIDQIQEWWNDEDITLTEKVLGVVTVFAGIRWMLRALTTFASAVAAAAGLRAVGAGWLFRLGLVTVSTPLKWVPVAAGATMFMMPKETREQLREQVRESFRQFRADIDRIWGEEFG